SDASPAANGPQAQKSRRRSQHAPTPIPRQTRRTATPPADCAPNALPQHEPQAQAARRGPTSRSPSAEDDPKQRSMTAPCSRVAAPQHAHATPPHPHPPQPPKQHSRQAANPPPDPAAQQPPPATRCHAAPALPRSPQAQSGSREPYPAGPRPPQPPNPPPRASAPSPRCGTSGPPQPHTDPQQNAPPSARHDQHIPAQPQPPLCKAPQQHQQAQAPGHHPKHRLGSCTEDDQSGCAHRIARLQPQIQWPRSRRSSDRKDW